MKCFAIIVGTTTFYLVLATLVSLQAQTFDERMSDWPLDLKINGVIIANGSDVASSAMIERFLADAGGEEEAKIVTVNFGSTSTLEQSKQRWDEAEHCHIDVPGDLSLDDSGEDSDGIAFLQESLSTASGVWLEADASLNPDHRRLLRHLTDNLRDVIDRNGVIYSSAATSHALGRHEITGGQMFGDQGHASIREGLNLIPDAVISTKFEQPWSRSRLLGVLGSHPRAIGIGLDEDTAIVFRGRKIWAMGAGKAHFMTMANERLPMRAKSLAEPESRRPNPYESLVDLTAWRRDAIDRTLEPFPPEQPQKPNVENGTLLIVGGGGMPDGMLDQFIELAGGDEARLVYIPCTERESVNPREARIVELWKSRGVAAADVVHTKDRTQANEDEAFLEPLKNATGIFFGGGRQWNFSDSYYGTEAHRLMKDVLVRGGVIAGSSAGASIQARYLARANPVGNFDIMAPGYERGGLGFISGVAIDQHFTQRNRQPDMTSLVNRYPQLLGIGIDERTALVVQGSIGQVVGENKVFFYDRNQVAAHDDPDYLALEAGQQFDLAARTVIEEAEPEK
ncbi:MAG: Type 1 glutamine amidotransferase-like domain-containing protein [Pirellulaceae bacterium]